MSDTNALESRANSLEADLALAKMRRDWVACSLIAAQLVNVFDALALGDDGDDDSEPEHDSPLFAREW